MRCLRVCIEIYIYIYIRVWSGICSLCDLDRYVKIDLRLSVMKKKINQAHIVGQFFSVCLCYFIMLTNKTISEVNLKQFKNRTSGLAYQSFPTWNAHPMFAIGFFSLDIIAHAIIVFNRFTVFINLSIDLKKITLTFNFYHL